MAFKHLISFASELLANFVCNWFRIIVLSYHRLFNSFHAFAHCYLKLLFDWNLSRLGRRFAAALLPRLFGKNPRSHHKGATSRVRTGDQRLPVLCHCQLGQDIPTNTRHKNWNLRTRKSSCQWLQACSGSDLEIWPAAILSIYIWKLPEWNLASGSTRWILSLRY